jgi:hypothetical protein
MPTFQTPGPLILTVRVSRRLQWRTRIGFWLMALGCRVATVGMHVVTDDDAQVER